MRLFSKSWVWIGCSLLGLASVACQRDTTTVSPVDTAATPPTRASEPTVATERVREHIGFLAADAQEGRAPGTEADTRVQDYVEAEMTQAGLVAGFGDGFRQSFEVTDGVRVKPGGTTALEFAGTAIAHHPLPFSRDTQPTGPAQGKFIYAGYGIPRGGKNTGDYETIGPKVVGKIVVALHGAPDDPHLSPADSRPQSKAIAARDHGAVGFVLWDPWSAVPFPNHGDANDLGVPAVFVGKEGSAALASAFVVKSKLAGKEDIEPESLGLRVGATSRNKGSLVADVEPVVLTTGNVAGYLPGTTDKVVAIGAHMDHLGYGTSSSLAPGERAIHNGADDNASGVAVMLEVCRGLAAMPATARSFSVVCLAFGAEEMGLLGSKHYVRALDAATRGRIVAMLNFDMVGRLAKDGVIVAGAGTSPLWPELLERTRGSLVVRTTEDGYGPSDHGSFYEEKIPVLHFFTGPHEDYHKPTDDLEKINYEGAAQIGNMALGVAGSLVKNGAAPEYIATARTAPAGGSGGFRVSLGTIPDYAAQVDGVRLSGVRGGGPAEKGGLQAGDVIQKIGARTIHNLDDYMAAFAELRPGSKVVVGVEREGARVELEIVPGAPRG